MPYDLYGTYYASRRDAENAEMAQVAQIDADIAMRKVDELERQLHYQQHQPSQFEYETELRLKYLERIVKELTEKKTIVQRVKSWFK